MVRPATTGDAEALGALHIRAWQEGYRGQFPDHFLDRLDIDGRIAWFRRAIEEDREILVAETEDSVAGFTTFGQSRSSEWGEIYAIYVDPDRWGRGHGFRLIGATEDRLTEIGFDRALLWVLGSNTRARDFYERQGWTLGKPVKIEEIGGVQVTEVRYEKELRA